MKRLFITLVLLFSILSISFGQNSRPASNEPSPNPDDARIVTSDITNFWRAYDMAKPETQLEIFKREYIDKGSIGLQDFVKLRISSAEALTKNINSHPKYYASIRESTLRIESFRPQIRAAFYAMKYLYEDAVFPDVYFLVGRMTSGGTLSNRALLIGAEMYGRTPNMPVEELGDWHRQVLATVDGVPHIVAHELIHYQQRKMAASNTLLSQSIREGSADFLAELISGRHINTHLHVYGNPNEKQLWEEFKKGMLGNDNKRWLYNGPMSKDRPGDLGYYMGYKIAEAYYNKAADKRQAVRGILEIKDFEQFLKDSGYEAKFGN
jgi:hypothetical protein